MRHEISPLLDIPQSTVFHIMGKWNASSHKAYKAGSTTTKAHDVQNCQCSVNAIHNYMPFSGFGLSHVLPVPDNPNASVYQAILDNAMLVTVC